jgi:flavodoxin
VKTLIVFYSRTGNTRAVAQAVALGMGAEMMEIGDADGQTSAHALRKPGERASVASEPSGEQRTVDPAAYDLVIVGTPIRNLTLSPPVRAWLADHGRTLQRVACFCTMAGLGSERAFHGMERLCGRKPLATMAVIDSDVKAGRHTAMVEEFVRTLQQVVVAA